MLVMLILICGLYDQFSLSEFQIILLGMSMDIAQFTWQRLFGSNIISITGTGTEK